MMNPRIAFLLFPARARATQTFYPTRESEARFIINGHFSAWILCE